MTKTKKIIAITVPIAVIVIVLAAVLIYFFACGGGPAMAAPDNFKLELYNYRIGYIEGDSANNTVDLTKAIPGGSDFTVTGDAVTLEGSNLTAVKAGTASLTYNTQIPDTSEGAAEDATVAASKTVTVTVLEGYKNVDTWEEFRDAALNSGSEPKIVVQSEMEATGNTISLNSDNGITSMTIYGNTLEIYAQGVIGSGATLFQIDYVDAELTCEDMYLVGARAKEAEGEAIDLTQFEGNGIFFVAYGSDDVFPVINLNHCMTENSQKHAYIRSAEMNVKGTVMKNGADALIGAETWNAQGAVINIENSALANSVVCGIILCGWTEVTGPEDYCTVNISGFLDIFNWKNRDNTRLMPGNDPSGVAGGVNNLVGKEVGKSKYDKNFVTGNDGNEYLHIGIIKLATDKLSENKSTVNGMDGVDYSEKAFPLPSAATIFAKTCLLYGYTPDKADNSSNYADNPVATLGNNENLNYELVNGRQ